MTNTVTSSSVTSSSVTGSSVTGSSVISSTVPTSSVFADGRLTDGGITDGVAPDVVAFGPRGAVLQSGSEPLEVGSGTAPSSEWPAAGGSSPDGSNASFLAPAEGTASALGGTDVAGSELPALALPPTALGAADLGALTASALAAAASTLAAAASTFATPRSLAAAEGGGALESREPKLERDAWDQIVGSRAGLQETVQRAQLLAGVDVTVLLEGETGVGKEVFARAIHASGPRRHAPFVALNCGGLSRDLLVGELFGYVEGAFTGARRAGGIGRIESAQGGTLFLDEIAELPLDLQPYLLRVLEGGELYPVGGNKPRQVKFRLISACNRTLRHQVNAGRFRMDLFYRISVTTLEVPPLRHRLEDLPALLEHFGREVAARHGLPRKRFSDEALAALGQYSWPGNVRELRNLIESVLLLTPGDTVGIENIPADVLGTETAEDFMKTGIRQAVRPDLEAVEREAISSAIRARRGNLTQVARDLRISRSTLYLKLKKHRLDLLLNQVRTND